MATRGPAYECLLARSRLNDDIQDAIAHPLPVSASVRAPLRAPDRAPERAPERGPAYECLLALSRLNDDIQDAIAHPLPVSAPVLASEFAPEPEDEKNDDVNVSNPEDEGDNLLRIGPDLDKEDILTGIDDKRSILAELEGILQRLTAKAQTLRAISDNVVVADPNKRTDDAFIAANKASESVSNARRWINHVKLEYVILLSCV